MDGRIAFVMGTGQTRTSLIGLILPALLQPPAGSGRFGNSGKRVIQAPGNWGTNTSLFKYFKLTEKVDFRIQAMFYNILNHPQFQYPDLNLNSPTASRIRATTYGYFTEIWSSRRTEVGIRFGW